MVLLLNILDGDSADNSLFSIHLFIIIFANSRYYKALNSIVSSVELLRSIYPWKSARVSYHLQLICVLSNH